MTTSPPKPEDESALVALENTLIEASVISDNYQSALETVQNKFVLAIRTATAVNALRKIMEHPDVVRLLRGLAGTSLGFLTDKDHREYSNQVIADCATEAVLRGFSLTGNEWNIIKGRPYFTKAGLQRKVREYPGINGTYDETLALPEILFTKEGKVRGAAITCSATWELKNTKGSISKMYQIRGDNTTGADAFIGKAARKLARDVLAKLQGQDIPEGDVDDLPDDARSERAKRAYVLETSSTTMPVLPTASDKTVAAEVDEIPGLGESAKPEITPPRETPGQKLYHRVVALMGSEDMFIRAMHVLNPTMPPTIQHISDLTWTACDKYLAMPDETLLKILDNAEARIAEDAEIQAKRKAAAAATGEIPFE